MTTNTITLDKAILKDSRTGEAPTWANKLLDASNKNVDAVRDLEKIANTQTAIKTLRVAMPAEAPWKAATLTSPTVNYGSGLPDAAYLMEPGGKVSLRGLVKSTVPDLATGIITTLPTGYGPSNELGFCAADANGTDVAFIRVHIGGVVVLYADAAATSATFLDCIQYLATNAAAPHVFTGAAWPMTVTHGLSKCTGLNVISCRPVSGSGPAGSPYVDWQDQGNGSVKIYGVWGLQWGSVYDVRVQMTSKEDK